MRSLYLLSVFLHIMAATVWVGGMIFLVLVLVPALRRPEFSMVAAALMRWSGMRFRWVSWICFGILLASGVGNVFLRGIGWQDLQNAEFWQGSFGSTLMIKLSLVTAILAVSGVHDFLVGPRAASAWQNAPAGAEARRLRRWAVHLGRLNLILALAVIALGIALARGAAF